MPKPSVFLVPKTLLLWDIRVLLVPFELLALGAWVAMLVALRGTGMTARMRIVALATSMSVMAAVSTVVVASLLFGFHR